MQSFYYFRGGTPYDAEKEDVYVYALDCAMQRTWQVPCLFFLGGLTIMKAKNSLTLEAHYSQAIQVFCNANGRGPETASQSTQHHLKCIPKNSDSSKSAITSEHER